MHILQRQNRLCPCLSTAVDFLLDVTLSLQIQHVEHQPLTSFQLASLSASFSSSVIYFPVTCLGSTASATPSCLASCWPVRGSLAAPCRARPPVCLPSPSCPRPVLGLHHPPLKRAEASCSGFPPPSIFLIHFISRITVSLILLKYCLKRLSFPLFWPSDDLQDQIKPLACNSWLLSPTGGRPHLSSLPPPVLKLPSPPV